MTDLSRKRDRDRLALDPNPYWQRLGKGQYLGWRSTSGRWLVRFGEQSPGKSGKVRHVETADGKKRERAAYTKGKQHYHVLEALRDDYDGALKAGQAWLAQMHAAGTESIRRDTVGAALKAYVADLRERGRHDTADEAEGRFKTTVYEDPLARIQLEELTKESFRLWRKRQSESKRREGKRPEARTVNRHVRAVAAGLNHAVSELSYIGNPATWKLKQLTDDAEDSGETAVFLDANQRAVIIAAAKPPAAQLLRALELTGARPKELAAALVKDFDGKTLRLAHRKGRGAALKVRYVTLDDTGVEFFGGLAGDRSQSAPLLTEDGEQTWRRHTWARAVQAAIAVVNEAKDGPEIPEGASAYSFRHARISELLQVHEIDPLTVGQQTGTSLAMIERAYFRFIPSAMLKKLEGLKA